jgi:hypothetical protein
MNTDSRRHRRAPGIATALAAVLLAAAGCTSSRGTPTRPPAEFRVTGTVYTSPACPGPVGIDSACPDRPLAGARVEVTRYRTVVATAVTDAAGHYALALAAGTYQVVATDPGGLRTHATRTVTVPPDAVADLTVDSGLR